MKKGAGCPEHPGGQAGFGGSFASGSRLNLTTCTLVCKIERISFGNNLSSQIC